MGKWKWEGVDKDGKKSKGEIDASSQKEARKLLRAKGMRPKRIQAPSILEFDLGEWMVESGMVKPFGTKELCMFTKQLAIMINAGIPILEALEILYKAQKNLALKRATKQIANDVGEGKTIADALSTQKGFSKLYCNLVRAGEAGGILDTILNKLSDHMDKQEKTKAQIKSAMTYPGIVSIVGFGVIWGLMVFVVPQFQEMLQDTGQETPWITQLVVDISEFFQAYTLKALPFIIGGLITLKYLVSQPAGKVVFDHVMMKMPIFGGIIIKGNLSSFSRTLSTMLSSGVALVDSLEICAETIDNSVIAKDVQEIKEQVIRGKSITEPLLKISYFPEMVGQMIKVGESTGNLDSMLLKVSDIFEDEVGELVENMTKLIEPLIIVVLGGIIAAVMVAMYLPIFMSAGGA